MLRIEYSKAANYDDALLKAADECQIDRDYWDVMHRRHEVSPDVRRGILMALGRDVSSFEAIEGERHRRFEENARSVLPKAAVISESEKSVQLTLSNWQRGASIRFDLRLESGAQLSGTVQVAQLNQTRELVSDSESWITCQLPLPSETPLGYHFLSVSLDERVIGQSTVIVCPDRCYLPDNLKYGGRTAGFNVSLYGLRSDRNWGCGDFTDLERLIQWARKEVGFSFVGLNPLHALHNRVPYNTSPYLPLSLFYKNLIYIDIERVPEFSLSDCARKLLDAPPTQNLLKTLRDSEFVKYHEVSQLKKRFLKVLYRAFRRSREQHPERARRFEEFCHTEGDPLHKFAVYCALDEQLHKQDPNRWTWQQWPQPYQWPDSPETTEFAARHVRLVEFYKYIQFVLNEQLSAAQQFAKETGMPIGIYHDLAVATDNCGSDLWAYRKFFVQGCRVGAPPDDFSPDGQDWAFPPPNVEAHLESGYALYRESIRKIVRNGGALRIDHVMRLFRLFWIPEGFQASQGIYVRDNAADLMRILALESVRSRNIIVGEDLGTVTDEIREMLSRFGILSYRLFYFEKHHPSQTFKNSWEYPRQALVASATHDLPTLAGFWTYRDIEARKAAGLLDEGGYWNQIADRKREKQRLLDLLHSENLLPPHHPADASHVPGVDGELHNAVIGFLAQVPSMLLLLNQEDFTKETEQQNLPGTTAQYPNWQRKMKVKVEDLWSQSAKPYSAMFFHQLARTGRLA
jgi:4-alpha-glucanotransferase